MPYIGNQHIVGDHINNFKVLDDISSYTETFNGASTNVVSTADNTIRIPEHRFIQGQRVTYTNGGGGNIGGLTTGTAYFVSFDSANTIKLATTLANANSNTVINLSAVGSGTSHTLNAAFDGVNTKFKITYQGGKEGRFNNATQLNVAINNVIQRPNLNPITFTEGFAIEDHHKIKFKVAPTVNDIFWGSIIANTIENFDLRDNEVDNFTGDGSTTEFTLSTIPANNESVVVSIDGVLQHPSDKNVVRAYTLIDSVIQFTAAPALNAEIQVRHIGFAGPSTNDVSGFYGRTGNVTLTANDHITTGDITARNFKATGITTFSGTVSTGAVTATSGTFSGNVSIGGTLTYEDVTNVDSVGIVTALGFKTRGTSSDSGVTNAFTAGRINLYDNGSHNIFRIGTYPSYAPTQWSTSSIVFSTNGFYVRNTAATRNYIGINNTTGILQLGYGASSGYGYKLETSAKGIKVGTGVTIETNGQAEIAGITTFYKDVHIKSATNRLYVGANDRISLIADPSHSYLRVNGGHFQIHNNNFGVRSYDGNGSIMLFYAPVNDGSGTGGPQLWHYHGSGVQIKRLSTTNSGVNIVGTTTSTQLAVTGVSTFTGAIDLNADLDVDGHTNLDNVNIAGVTTTGNLYADNLYAQSSLTINNNSNVSINLTSTSTSGSSRIFFGDPDSALVGRLTYSHNGDYMQFFTAYGERLRIKGNGYVGIGTDNPTTLLHIDDDAADPYLRIGGSGRDCGIQLSANSNFTALRADGANRLFVNAGADSIRFSIGGTSSSYEKLRINSSGHLSLGGSNVTDVNMITINGTGQTQNIGIVLNKTNSPAKAYGVNIHNGTGDFIFFDYTANTERLRIDTNGDVVIGTNTWNYKKPLNIQGSSGSIISIFNGDTTTYAANTNSSLEFKLKTGSSTNHETACEIRGFKENGTDGNSARGLNFWTGESGTSPNERFRITSYGDVYATNSAYNTFDTAATSVNTIVEANENRPGVYWLNFNGVKFRAYVKPNWLQGRNWVLAAKYFDLQDMPSGSSLWTNDTYVNESDFNLYGGLMSKYRSWRYFSFNRLAMQMGNRIPPIMQFDSSQTLYGAFSGGRANNGGGVTANSTDPAMSGTSVTYHNMNNYVGPDFHDVTGSEDRMQSYGLNKWANNSTNGTAGQNQGSEKSHTSQRIEAGGGQSTEHSLDIESIKGYRLTVEDSHPTITNIDSIGVAGAWIGCPLDEGNSTQGSNSSNNGADSGFGFGFCAGNPGRTGTAGYAEWGNGGQCVNTLPAYIWLSID